MGAYREYLANGNVSVIGSPGTRAPRRKRIEVPSPTNGNGAKKNGNGEGHAPDVTGSLIDYPFPLRSGQVAHLRLPMKLEKSDADRLGAFIRTLVYEPQLELTAEAGGAI